MREQKLCPFRLAGTLHESNTLGADCVQGACEWWVDDSTESEGVVQDYGYCVVHDWGKR